MRLECLLLSALLGLTGCMSTPAPSLRAHENLNMCAEYLSQGDLDRAEIHCDLGLQFAPQWADLWVNKGLIHYRREQKDAAKKAYIKAIKLNPESAQGHNNLGAVYRDEQALGAAHDQFMAALKIDPDYVEARYNLALTLMQMGEKVRARKEYRTIVAINPSLADPHHDLGLIAFQEGAYHEAVEEFGLAVQLDPQFGKAYEGLGLAMMELGHYKEAAVAFTACIDVDAPNLVCRQNLPIANRKAALSGPQAQAREEDEEAGSTGAAAFYSQGKMFRQKGLLKEEESSYKKCVKSEPRFAPCHFALFNLFREDRRDKEARKACQNFLKAATAEEFPSEYSTCDRYLASGTF
jgi:tetratricopeptide (TPR) repeat protein